MEGGEKEKKTDYKFLHGNYKASSIATRLFARRVVQESFKKEKI